MVEISFLYLQKPSLISLIASTCQTIRPISFSNFLKLSEGAYELHAMRFRSNGINYNNIQRK